MRGSRTGRAGGRLPGWGVSLQSAYLRLICPGGTACPASVFLLHIDVVHVDAAAVLSGAVVVGGPLFMETRVFLSVDLPYR